MSWEKWFPVFLKEQEEYQKIAPKVSPSHRTDHILRVWKVAKEMCERLGGDMEIMAAAVALHDLGRHHGLVVHGPKSAELAKPILESRGFPKDKIPNVLEAISQHDYDFPKEKRKLLESKILNDADRADVFGVIGVYRHVLFINAGRMKIEEVIPFCKMRWNSIMLQESRDLLKDDYDYIVDFFKTLRKELES
ncbi:MAG: HD domain-containing protein [Candidatus Aenigmarchaeota archaeon]|nr:HD domain-containing protein [Candidatus Aenigmarchaeota archaeon]